MWRPLSSSKGILRVRRPGERLADQLANPTYLAALHRALFPPPTQLRERATVADQAQARLCYQLVILPLGNGWIHRTEAPAAAIGFSELLPNGDLYGSITVPSLIVATYGGGTGLATQRECLELLGCYGAGGVRKLAEIVAATVLCGELSLGSAILAEEWVKAHDVYGRNRP